MIETNIFDMSSFEKLKTTHDGHGRVSCQTRTELEKYFDLEVVNKIVNKLYMKILLICLMMSLWKW